jgi:hypothetical protein
MRRIPSLLLAGLIAWNLSAASPATAQVSLPSAPTNRTVNDSPTGNYKLLPPESTWKDVVAAYNAASSGDTIALPNEKMDQTAAIWWVKSVSLVGSGPLSGLVVRGNLSLFGASDAILIGADNRNPTSNVTFADFTIEHARVPGFAFRNNPISTGDYTTNITIRGMTFLGCTANCIQILSNNAGPVRNISVIGNRFIEFYEAAIAIDGMNIDGVQILNNNAVTSSGNPSGGVSRPQGVFVGNEQAAGNPPRFGTIKYVVIDGNFIDFRPLGNNNGQSLGITLATGNQTRQSAPDAWRYDQIRITNNKIYHADIGIRIQGTHGWQDTLGPSRFWIERNFVEDSTDECVSIQSGASDTFEVNDNTFHINFNQSGVGLTIPGPIIRTTVPNRIVSKKPRE